ncbi:MAG: sensor histidine kinase [Rhizobium sp.]|nr:sensor histidine kinase [Rhizobium sp.]
MKKRLFAVALTALIPAIGMLAYNEFWYRQQRDVEVRAAALQASRQAASEIDRILDGARSLLVATSAVPAVQAMEPASCHTALAEIAPQIPSVASISVLDTKGIIVCSSVEAAAGTDLSDRRYFREAVQSDDFVTGGYTKGRVSGSNVLPVAKALHRNGKILGVIVAGIKVSWLQARLLESGTIAGGVVAIADRDGILIARVPYRDGIVGTKVSDEFMYLLTAKAPGTVEAPGRDGVVRIIGYQPISADSPLYISSGIPKSVAQEPINRATIAAVLLIAVGGIASAFAAVFVGNRFILRPIQKVVSVLERWAGGDIAARTGMHGRQGEIGQVGASVDNLLDELSRRRLRAEEAEAARSFLTRELSHRIKNTLSVVQAIARQTFGRIVPPEALETYSLRVRALAGAYDTLLAEDWESGDIHDVVERAISPHHDATDDHFKVEGPDISLPPQAVIALTLVIHELATNAAKYGALSNFAGHVDITWSSGDDGISLEWREHGGPNVAAPEKEGFGTKVISRAFPPEYQPDVKFDYRPEGLNFTLRFKPTYPETHEVVSDNAAA